MIEYLNAYEQGDPVRQFLWQMMEEALTEPHTTISHVAMPTWDEHVEWLRKKTQRELLIIAGPAPGVFVGFVSLTYQNEIGIRIRKTARGLGFGKMAVKHILANYEPLVGLPSVRPGRFVANINPANEASIRLFTGLGAKHIQQTYAF